MDLQSYIEFTPSVAIYRKEDEAEFMYLSLGIASEAGELIGKIAKVWRGDKTLDGMSEKIAQELGDLLWFCSQIHNREKHINILNTPKLVTQLIIDSKTFHSNEMPYVLSSLASEIFTLSSYFLTVSTLKGEYARVNTQQIAKLATYCGFLVGYSLEEILTMNYEKLTGRQYAGTLAGNGDGIYDRDS
jgi:hypothetical protein